MKTKHVFENNNCSDKLIRDYISVYLKTSIGYFISSKNIQYKKLSYDNIDMYVVVLKDDIRRIDIKSGGSGVLRQKQWSVFVFNFIELNNYIKFFGRNEDKKDIVSPYYNNQFEEFEYEKEQTKYNGIKPNKIFSGKKIKYLLHNFIFSKISKQYKYLCWNTYVYSVISILDIHNSANKEIDVSTYYYNTNHKFKQVSSKNIINQKTDINLTSYLVQNINEELEIIEKNYNDMVDLVNAYKGNLPLNSITSLNYLSIKKDIDNRENFIITEGTARTGKTIIAMRILGAYMYSKLVIMNPYFYKSLVEIFEIEKIAFPFDRIVNHTEFKKVEDFLINSSILVIDEAQRLKEEQIDIIVKNNKKNINIFLGDNLQKLNRKFDKGIKIIEDKIYAADNDYKKYYFNHSIGISNNVLQAIKYLVFDNILLCNENINNYEINIYNDVNVFRDKYRNDSTFRKHIATIYMGDNDYNTTIDGFSRWDLQTLKAYPYFLDKDVKESVMLTTYEMISRELDSIYIYLPKEVYANEKGLHYQSYKTNVDEYLLNQIYVLMTRAKGSINIYCENKSAYNYFITRYNQIIKVEEQSIKLSKTEIDKSKNIEDKIEERGITRLVHFTSIENLESIYKRGLMYISKLNEYGINYDHNDDYRLDKVYDGISLSIQNPNNYLLKSFQQKYPTKKYVLILLDPALLYEITDDSGEKLAERFYCNYNASSKITKRSDNDLEIMFGDSFDGGSWINTRVYKEDSDPTSEQAEILFRQTIDPKYIMEVVEL